MSSIQLRFTRSFYSRHAFVGGLLAFLCLVMILTMKQLGPLRFLAPVVFMGQWLFLVLREYRLAARLMDDEGVTRRDGRRFLWLDLQRLQEVHMRFTPGQQGPLNHVDLLFTGGRVRILYLVLENGIEAIQFARRKAGGRMDGLRRMIYDLISWRTRSGPRTPEADGVKPEPKWSQTENPRAEPAWPERSSEPFAPPARTRTEPQPLPPQSPAGKCPVCGELENYHSATQTVGHEEEDTWLPAAESKLKLVQAEVRHPDHGKGELKQCPECGAWFFYRTIYEFLIPGSYDEQILIRLSGVEAERLRQQSDAIRPG